MTSIESKINLITSFSNLKEGEMIDWIECDDQRINENTEKDDSEEDSDQEDQEDNSEELNIRDQSNGMKLQSPSHIEAIKAAEILMNYIIMKAAQIYL